MKLRRPLLLLAIPILLAGIWLLTPQTRKVQVRGPLSTTDVKAIRHRLRRAQWGNVRRAAARKQFRRAYEELTRLTWPLKSVETHDGQQALAYLQDAALGDMDDFFFGLTKHGNKWSSQGSWTVNHPGSAWHGHPPPGN